MTVSGVSIEFFRLKARGTSSRKFNQNPFASFVLKARMQRDIYELPVGIHSRTHRIEKIKYPVAISNLMYSRR